jgi:arylsulfatase A-like enzyme
VAGVWATRAAREEEPEATWRDATFGEFHGDQARAYPVRSVFTGRYKYIYHFCADDELYDVDNDPQETHSLAADPQYAGLKNDLRGRLIQWMRETGDFLDVERDADFTPADWVRFRRQREFAAS